MKLTLTTFSPSSLRSPPSRGAWIEICVWGGARMTHTVAPLAGGVD